jgi:membrane-associated phospholipid phosphatase
MPALVLILLSVFAGVAAGLIAHRYPWRHPGEAEVAIGHKVGESARAHPRFDGTLEKRLDPQSATGLALSIALVLVALAGVVLGLLAYLVRTNARLAAIDNSVAKWGNREASPISNHVLNAVTQLGSIYVVVGLAIVLAAVELHRTGGKWIVPFVVAVVAGEEIVATVIKDIVDRTRPAFNPAAATLGPSFPSGHTTTAAAFYAACALLLGRRRPRATRAVLAGGAVGIAVAVASSRVLLDVHWLTDVIGGLALGWAWFTLCSIAFGGRLLRFGVVAEVAERVAESDGPTGDQVAARPHAPTLGA